jgi:hypothetical protein
MSKRSCPQHGIRLYLVTLRKASTAHLEAPPGHHYSDSNRKDVSNHNRQSSFCNCYQADVFLSPVPMKKQRQRRQMTYPWLSMVQDSTHGGMSSAQALCQHPPLPQQDLADPPSAFCDLPAHSPSSLTSQNQDSPHSPSFLNIKPRTLEALEAWDLHNLQHPLPLSSGQITTPPHSIAKGPLLCCSLKNPARKSLASLWNQKPPLPGSLPGNIETREALQDSVCQPKSCLWAHLPALLPG